MKSLFSQSALVVPQFWGFEAIFEARGKIFSIFKNSFCNFYCTLNDRLDPTVFNAKIGLKNGPPRAEIFAKMFLNMARQTKPQPHFGFSQISRPSVVPF